MRKRIRVFTLFSGYDSQFMALKLFSSKHPEYEFELVGWCEIDDAAIRSHNSVFPEYANVHHKDVKMIDWHTVPDFELLFYSSCCQSLSLTGAMEGMEKGSGTQSSLIWYVLDAIEIKRPQYCILENVKNIVSKTFLPSFIDWMRAVDDLGYHSAAKSLNSSDFGILQNRERVFMVSIRDDIKQVYKFPRYKAKEEKRATTVNKNVEDSFTAYLEESVDEKYYYPHQEVVKYILALSGKKINQDQIRKVSVPCGGSMKKQMPSLTCKKRNGGWAIPTLKATGYGNGNYKNFYTTGYWPQVAVLEIWQTNLPLVNYNDIIAKAEDVEKKGTSITNASRGDIMYIINTLQTTEYLRLRLMTPKEQFEFMGVRDEYIAKLLSSGNEDKQLYSQAGNSIVIDVLYHLFLSLYKNKIQHD